LRYIGCHWIGGGGDGVQQREAEPCWVLGMSHIHKVRGMRRKKSAMDLAGLKCIDHQVP
jgi:hypothetical protein